MLWQSDGDMIVPDGSLVKGRNQIENFYSGVFSGVFAGGYGASTAIATIGQLRFLSADLALIDGQFIVRRVLSANNQELPPERGFFSIIPQRVSSRWLIVASREMEPLLGSNTVTQPGEARQSGFGNHLQLVTLGFVAFDLPVGVPDRSRLYYRWSRESAAA
jgi:hypothetical protein